MSAVSFFVIMIMKNIIGTFQKKCITALCVTTDRQIQAASFLPCRPVSCAACFLACF